MTDVDTILTSIGQASYVWDIEESHITWSDNFHELVGFKSGVEIDDARAFETLLSADSPQTRYAAVHQQQSPKAADTGYQCVYAIKASKLKGGDLIWLEDTGRWQENADGKPVRAEGIVRIVNERRRREEKLKRKSEIDELTGLANRRILQDAIGRTADACFMENKSAAFLLISLCDFERINYAFGFDAGDEVLQQVTNLLQSQMRNDDFVSRFSGAKFGLIIRQSGEEEVEVAAKRLFNAINGKVLKTKAGPVSLKLAIGACLLPRHARNAHEAIASVTSALDIACNSFGTKIHLYSPDPEMRKRREADARLLSRFVEAMERDAMVLAFQPVLKAESGKLAFHEALLRFEGINQETIEDADFIRLAEDLGLMRNLDLKTLRMGLDVLEIHSNARLSLNVTHESLEDGEWLDTLVSRISGTPEIAEHLIVELTESHLPKNLGGTCAAITQMQELGCHVAIDDFGAGYTSFTHLRDLGADIIKVDGSYARNLSSDPASETFLKAIRDIAQSFNMETVVEWVEDMDTAIKLRDWGFTYLQGSLYGMPLRAVPWDRNENSNNTNQASKA